MAPDGSGDLHRLTPDVADVHPSVSADGKRLSYRVHISDNHDEIRVLDLESGRQIARIARDLDRDEPPILSPAGDEIAYVSSGLFRMRLPDGTPERVSRRGFNNISCWTADGKRMIVQHGRRGLGLLDTQSGEEREFLRDERFPIVEARFSPDDKWVAFTLASRPHPRIHIVPVETPGPPWIAVTASDVSAASPAWSADTNQIYFLAQCQGFRCIWARRLDPHRKQPQGEPFPVRHFQNARYSLLGGIDPQNVGLVSARDKLVFGMFETTGNIWSLPALPRP